MGHHDFCIFDTYGLASVATSPLSGLSITSWSFLGRYDSRSIAAIYPNYPKKRVFFDLLSLQDGTAPSEFARTGFKIYKAPMALSKLQSYFSIVYLPGINISTSCSNSDGVEEADRSASMLTIEPGSG